MTEPIRIANCSGFLGDRASAAREMVDGGPIDVLTGDWLAELTMLILARIGMKHPGKAFARPFVAQMEEVMGTCLDRGIKVVSNAGGLNPDGCAEAVADVAARLGLNPTIAYIDGDNLADRAKDLIASRHLTAFEQGDNLGDGSTFLTANAYLGCWGIVDALNRGADIVITGRVTDAAVVCGPAAWHHGWQRDSWNELAGAVAAGHVIECGAQATGGNYSFVEEIPGLADGTAPRIGFPWADIAADGSSVIGRHDDHLGGAVTVGTITSQLLYEIGGARYYGPDVTARFDTVELTEIGPDRVRISGTTGEPPPPTLKVAMNELGGFRNSFRVAVTGLDIETKCRIAEATFWDAYPFDRDDIASVTSTIVRTDQPDPGTQEQATAVWSLIVRDPDDSKIGRAFTDAMVATALSSIPGMYSVSGMPTGASPYGVYRPGLIPADLVPQHVHIGDAAIEVSSVAPATQTPAAHDQTTEALTTQPEHVAPVETNEPTTLAPLGTIAGTRSGDKGGHANLGVFVRTDAEWSWLDAFLTTDRLRELLPETAELDIERHRFPNLRALNFVVRNLLQEGVAASTRQDAQAKALGEWLRARIVPIHRVLVTTDNVGIVTE